MYNLGIEHEGAHCTHEAYVYCLLPLVPAWATLLGLAAEYLVWLVSTKGRHGVLNVSSLLDMLVSPYVPLPNRGIVCYFGKGVYVIATKQEYASVQT